MKFYFTNLNNKIICQTQTGECFEYIDPVVNADKLIDYFEREQFGGRFRITKQWKQIIS